MNKLIKKGFSLAEVLIALSIISIIATMGFSIAKKGIADAYQGYFYTGYVGLNSALQIAKEDLFDNKINVIGQNNSNITYNDYLNHIKHTLRLKQDQDVPINQICFIAPNGIRYIIGNPGDPSATITEPPSLEIEMFVPSVKTDLVDVNERFVALKYSPDNDFLKISTAPFFTATQASSNIEKYKSHGFVSNLGDRKDLLLFVCKSEAGGPIFDCESPTDDPQLCKDEDRTLVEYNPPRYTTGSYNEIIDAECLEKTVANPKYVK